MPPRAAREGASRPSLYLYLSGVASPGCQLGWADWLTEIPMNRYLVWVSTEKSYRDDARVAEAPAVNVASARNPAVMSVTSPLRFAALTVDFTDQARWRCWS